MGEWEVAAENGHRVRVLAEDEAEAFETAVTVDPDIETGGAYPADGKPVGWDGDDDAALEGYEIGDYT